MADTHGCEPSVPHCDLLLVGGDVCPVVDHSLERQRRFLGAEFARWLRGTPARARVGIAGNHDFIAAASPELMEALPWTYLSDSATTVEGVHIWGTPYTPTFGPWAFMEDERMLEHRFGRIPDDTDVLLVHGPPYLHCDHCFDGKDAGSRALLTAIERVQPALVVCGHIHEAGGVDTVGRSLVVNASVVDLSYRQAREPVVIELTRSGCRWQGALTS